MYGDPGGRNFPPPTTHLWSFMVFLLTLSIVLICCGVNSAEASIRLSANQAGLSLTPIAVSLFSSHWPSRL